MLGHPDLAPLLGSCLLILVAMRAEELERNRSLRLLAFGATVVYLNHGSFGATPRPVLQAQQRWREALERQPVRFLIRDLEAKQQKNLLAFFDDPKPRREIYGLICSGSKQLFL